MAQPLDMRPGSCAARNTHSRSEADIAAAAAAWEPTPPTHLQLDLRPLLDTPKQVCHRVCQRSIALSSVTI